MNCTQCRNSYNITDHIPRLLTSCGHSFCEPCLAVMIEEAMRASSLKIHCIICQSVTLLNESNDIKQLPKNLSLIESIVNNAKRKCVKHSKDLEVYCENDKTLLCINCILENNHKDHSLLPIDQAYQKEKQGIDESIEELVKRENIIRQSIKAIEDKITHGNDNANELISNTNAFFEELIEKIRQRQNEIITGIKQSNEDNQCMLIKKKDAYDHYIILIENILKDKQGNDTNNNNYKVDFLLDLKDYDNTTDEICKMYEEESYDKDITLQSYLNQSMEINNLIISLEDFHKKKTEEEDSNKDKEKSINQTNKSNGEIHHINFTNNSTTNYANDSVESSRLNCMSTRIPKTDFSYKSVSNGNEPNEESTDHLQSTFNYVDRNSTKNHKPISSKNKDHKTLFPPLKTSSSKQINLINTLKTSCAIMPSSPKQCNSLNSSVNLSVTSNINCKPKHTSSNNLHSNLYYSPYVGSKHKTHILFNNNESKGRNDTPVSPFLQDYILENNTLSNVDNADNNSMLSMNTLKFDNQQEISLLYKEVLTSYIFIGGKSDVITRKWCIDNGEWSTLAKESSKGNSKDIAIERSDYVLLKYKENSALVIGGKVNLNGMESVTDSIQLFDIDKKTLDKLDFKLNKPKCAFGGLYIHSQIFIAGGCDGRFVSNEFVYFDKNVKQWYDLPKMFHKRKHFAFVQTFDNCIVAIGGQNEKEHILKNVEKYDLYKKTWIKLRDINQNRKGCCALCMPDGIYVFGGYDGAQYLKSVEKYDFITKKWSYLSDMNSTKSDFCAIPSHDCRYIYTFGGYNGKPLNIIEQFDVFANKWENISTMPSARYKHYVIESIIENNRNKK